MTNPKTKLDIEMPEKIVINGTVYVLVDDVIESFGALVGNMQGYTDHFPASAIYEHLTWYAIHLQKRWEDLKQEEVANEQG